MKSLHRYINEKLIITNKTNNKLITPSSRQELITIILKHFKSHNGDLNDIDVSELKEKYFYSLFYDLRDEIDDNNITEIDISDWDLKELYFNENMSCGMFERCDTLKTIILPDCLEVIDEYTFYECDKLDNIIIPDSVTKICGRAFYGCGELRSIIIPDLVTDIGIRAFDECSRLESIIIPDSVKSIGTDAFDESPKLTITVPNKRVKKLVEECGFDGKIKINELQSH